MVTANEDRRHSMEFDGKCCTARMNGPGAQLRAKLRAKPTAKQTCRAPNVGEVAPWIASILAWLCKLLHLLHLPICPFVHLLHLWHFERQGSGPNPPRGLPSLATSALWCLIIIYPTLTYITYLCSTMAAGQQAGAKPEREKDRESQKRPASGLSCQQGFILQSFAYCSDIVRDRFHLP